VSRQTYRLNGKDGHQSGDNSQQYGLGRNGCHERLQNEQRQQTQNQSENEVDDTAGLNLGGLLICYGARARVPKFREGINK